MKLIGNCSFSRGRRRHRLRRSTTPERPEGTDRIPGHISTFDKLGFNLLDHAPQLRSFHQPLAKPADGLPHRPVIPPKKRAQLPQAQPPLPARPPVPMPQAKLRSTLPFNPLQNAHNPCPAHRLGQLLELSLLPHVPFDLLAQAPGKGLSDRSWERSGIGLPFRLPFRLDAQDHSRHSCQSDGSTHVRGSPIAWFGQRMKPLAGRRLQSVPTWVSTWRIPSPASPNPSAHRSALWPDVSAAVHAWPATGRAHQSGASLKPCPALQNFANGRAWDSAVISSLDQRSVGVGGKTSSTGVMSCHLDNWFWRAANGPRQAASKESRHHRRQSQDAPRHLATSRRKTQSRGRNEQDMTTGWHQPFRNSPQ